MFKLPPLVQWPPHEDERREIKYTYFGSEKIFTKYSETWQKWEKNTEKLEKKYAGGNVPLDGGIALPAWLGGWEER